MIKWKIELLVKGEQETRWGIIQDGEKDQRKTRITSTKVECESAVLDSDDRGQPQKHLPTIRHKLGIAS